MTYSKYLNDPLDERYLIEPGEYVEEGAIPDEELEVRKQLAALKLCEERLRKCGFFWRLFNSEEYKGYLHIGRVRISTLRNENETFSQLNSITYIGVFLRLVTYSHLP